MISKLIKNVPKTGGKKNIVPKGPEGAWWCYVKLTEASHFASLYLEGYRWERDIFTLKKYLELPTCKGCLFSEVSESSPLVMAGNSSWQKSLKLMFVWFFSPLVFRFWFALFWSHWLFLPREFKSYDSLSLFNYETVNWVNMKGGFP